jgi:hypothetical protein
MRFPVHRVRVRAYIPRAAVALCTLTAGVLSWSTVAQGATGHGFSSAFGTFTSAAGVAVDDSAGASKGDVYVVDQGTGRVDRFTASEAANGEAGKQLTGVTLVAPHSAAVDDSSSTSAGDVYVTEPAEGVVDKFNGATGVYEAQLDGHEVPHAGSFEPVGVGVDPANGDVFVTDAHNGVVDVFTAAGKYSSQFGAGSPTGVAVNGAGDAYVSTASGEAFEFIAAGEYTSVLPVGVGVSAVSVDPASGDVYLDQGSSIEELGAGGESLGSFGAEVLAGSEGVGIDSATGTVYASNGANAAIFAAGETPKELVVTDAPVEVTGSTATFKGRLAGGETGYYFAYNAGQSCTGTGAGESEPGAATGSAEVSTAVSGLLPATQYTVCLVATNSFGQTQGTPVTFTTSVVAPAVGGESFSDVGSGSATLNAQVDPQGSPTTYYYEYGPTSAYGSNTAEVTLGAGTSALSAPAQLIGLTGSGEYHFRVVAVSAAGIERGEDVTFRALPVGILGLPDDRVFERVTPVENDNANVYYSEAFGFGLAFSEGVFTREPFEAAADGDAVMYAGDPTGGGIPLSGPLAGNEYLATRFASGGWKQINLPQSGYPLGSEFGTSSSADLSKTLVEENGNLYVSADGQLSLVNVLPDGATEANAVRGAPRSGEGRNSLPDFSHAISADGSRVFWTDLNTDDLYVRENPTDPQSPIVDGKCTVSADACTVLISEGGRFWTATSNGSTVFFTNGDLYEYDVESGQTTDLTPGVEGAGVVGTSENGEYLYYADAGGRLKLWHDGISTFIAALSGEDGGNAKPYREGTEHASIGDWQPGLGNRTADVASDGSAVVFLSNQSLKAVGYPNGYPNRGFDEVYVYEAETDQLFCASCNPSGEPPENNKTTEDGEAAAFLPVSYSSTFIPRSISEDGGQVFFDSDEPLVPQDTNGKQDVYEWERDGTGSCQEADGCIYLLSGGIGGSASWLLDASASGSDVFIISRTELVPGDPYDSFDVYDARVGGVQPLAPPACSGTGCQGVPPAQPIFATPASVTFAGVGNFAAATPVVSGSGKPKAKSLTRTQKLAAALKTCRKKQKRKRTLCEAQARKRYAAKPKARKSARQGEGR